MRMGGGGLLAEIPSRPLPRAEAKRRRREERPQRGRGSPRCCSPPANRAAWAAQQAARRDRRHADGGAGRAAAARLAGAADRRRARQQGRRGRRGARQARRSSACAIPTFADGLSTSLKRGIAALPPDIDGALVCLGDMPLVAGRRYRPADRAPSTRSKGRAIIVPTRRGKRGNPVLWARRFFPEMAQIAGDVGARHLIGEHAELVAEVEMDDDASSSTSTPPKPSPRFARRGSQRLRTRRLSGPG